MVFRFELAELGVGDNLRLAVKAEFDRAIAEVGETGFEVHGTVRNVRRRLKRVRAALKLIRPAFPDYAAESRALREIGAHVSALRDAQALVEATDLVAARHPVEAMPALLRVRRSFVERAAAHEARLDRDAFLGDMRQQLRDARVRSELWELRHSDHRAVVPGFVETYRRARRGWQVAADRREEEHFHEWRKRVKDHWIQLGLLRGIAPEFADGRRRVAGRLARTLGDYQNLSLLLAAVGDEDAAFETADKASVLAASDRDHRRLGRRALKLGALLFDERPREIAARWNAYWDGWQQARKMARRG